MRNLCLFVNDHSENGTNARYQVLCILGGPTELDLLTFRSLSFDEQHAELVRKQAIASYT